MAPFVTINEHTTSSSPSPHILYTIQTTLDGTKTITNRRYSEFVSLHGILRDPFELPPKRLLTTSLVPSRWIDNSLITQRKAGLTKYLSNLLKSHEYKDSTPLLQFLCDNDDYTSAKLDAEDVVPSSASSSSFLELKSTEGTAAAATPIAATYYTEWTAAGNPPEKIDFSKFDIIFFAFATPSSSSTVSFGSGSEAILKRLATAAHNSGKGTKVVLSIGGWGGCQYYSASVSTSANRTKFINSISSAIKTNGLDGVDIDWEYPNSPGAGQPYSPADSANLLSFFQTLRKTIGTSKIISAAVTQLPWLGSDGKALKDVSAYAAQMNYVNIMNYDVFGASPNPGPNAPLGNPCGTSKQPQANAEAAFKQWTAAGFPASKLLLGLPLYGYVSQSSKTVLTGSSLPTSDMLLLDQRTPLSTSKALTFDRKKISEKESLNTEQPLDVDHDDMHFLNGAHSRHKLADSDFKTNAVNLSSWWGQQIPFNALVKAGALVEKSGSYDEAGGFTKGWDNCSNTPYLYNTAQTTVVTYDDTDSLGAKAAFAKKNRMAGCFTWAMDQDDGMTLQNAIRKSLGK